MKDLVYKLFVSLDNFCGCPAGKGPTASCKHVAPLCYTVMLFCECGQLLHFLTYIKKLQEWNQPRLKRPAQGKCFTSCPVPGYDPCPPHLQSADPEALEWMFWEWTSHMFYCMQLLTPSVDKIEHDHMYAQQTLVAETSTDLNTPPTTNFPTAEELEVMCQETRKTFNVSSAKRKNI